jgi:hypothetical protein
MFKVLPWHCLLPWHEGNLSVNTISLSQFVTATHLAKGAMRQGMSSFHHCANATWDVKPCNFWCFVDADSSRTEGCVSLFSNIAIGFQLGGSSWDAQLMSSALKLSVSIGKAWSTDSSPVGWGTERVREEVDVTFFVWYSQTFPELISHHNGQLFSYDCSFLGMIGGVQMLSAGTALGGKEGAGSSSGIPIEWRNEELKSSTLSCWSVLMLLEWQGHFRWGWGWVWSAGTIGVASSIGEDCRRDEPNV